LVWGGDTPSGLEPGESVPEDITMVDVATNTVVFSASKQTGKKKREGGAKRELFAKSQSHDARAKRAEIPMGASEEGWWVREGKGDGVMPLIPNSMNHVNKILRKREKIHVGPLSWNTDQREAIRRESFKKKKHYL